MSPHPLVSVVIPCFNGEGYIDAAIRSVLAQSHPGIEVIVVNDGSTDKTQQIVQAYGAQVILINQSNAGVSRARREGVRKATGDYIKFLDSDDVLPAGALTALLDVARKFPGDAVIGRTLAIDSDGCVIDEDMYNLACHPLHLEMMPYEYLLTQATQSGLWLLPKIIIDSDRFFNDGVRLGEEYAFCLELIDTGCAVRYCDKVVCHIRVHDSPARLSRSKNEADHLIQVGLISTAVDTIREKIKGHSQEALILIARLCWSRGRDCLRIDCRNAAEAYFALAKRIQPGLRPVGSGVYRSFCRIAGPVAAEKVMDGAKGVLNALKLQ